MGDYTTKQEVTFRDYLHIIFRRKAVIITTFITVMLSVIIGLQFITPVYEGRVKILISAEKQVVSPYYRELMGYQSVQAALTQSEIVKSNAVIERAVAALGLLHRPRDYEKKFCSPLKAPLVDLKILLFDFINRIISPQLAHMTTEQKNAYQFRIATEDLKLNIAIEPVANTNIFTLVVTDFSPFGAAIMANVISRSYVIFDLEQQLAETQLKYGEKHPITIQLKDNIDKMVKNLNGELLPNEESIGPASVKIIEQASAPLDPQFSLLFQILTIGLSFFVALFLGVILAFMFEYMDQTFKTSRDIELVLNMPFLGAIHKIAKKTKESPLIEDTGIKTAYAQSYQNLSDQIYLLSKDKDLKSILITAASVSDGKDTIIYNIGKYLSGKGRHKVIIIDADLRNQSLSKIFNVSDSSFGLAEVLEGKCPLEKAVRDLASNLVILPAGRTTFNPITLLGSHKMQEVIREMKEKYELILMGCAALNEFKDGAMLSLNVDGVILVVNEGKTRRQVVKNAILPLEQKKANLIGAILNNRTFPIPEKIYKRV